MFDLGVECLWTDCVDAPGVGVRSSIAKSAFIRFSGHCIRHFLRLGCKRIKLSGPSRFGTTGPHQHVKFSFRCNRSTSQSAMLGFGARGEISSDAGTSWWKLTRRVFKAGLFVKGE